MIDEAFGTEGPCDVCGKMVDDCICPECPVCHAYGDPQCYKEHGLTRSQEQIDSRQTADRLLEEELERENAFYKEYGEG